MLNHEGKTLLNAKLECLQILISSRGRAKSPRPRRQVKKDRRRSYRYVENVFGRQRWYRALQPAAIGRSIWIHSTNVENIRQITPFYAKQSQFYAFFTPKRRFHEKTNPIQTQFKANITQNKPNLSQFKPKTKPI